jgi:hypothetical protein
VNPIETDLLAQLDAFLQKNREFRQIEDQWLVDFLNTADNEIAPRVSGVLY